MPKYECHITFNLQDRNKVYACGLRTGWKFSEIDGDAIMENKPWCYLTNYDSDSKVLEHMMDDVTSELARQGVIPTRLKIERIIYDTKTGLDERGDA